mgnify:CR=1 FL=1
MRQLEILPEPPPTRDPATPWPEWPRMRRDSSSHQEGGERRWCVTTLGFEGADGRLSGLRCAEVEWVDAADGRPTPRPKAGSEFVLAADLALIAMGFAGPVRGRLLRDLGVSFDERGHVVRDANHQTAVPGVFASGDLARGASLVVHAIADGRGAFVSLTPEGRAAIVAAAPRHVEEVRRHFVDLLAPEQLDTMADIAAAVLESLQPEDQDAPAEDAPAPDAQTEDPRAERAGG